MPGRLAEMALRGEALRGLRVIDAHGHLGGAGAFDNPLREPGQMVEVMDRVGVQALATSHLLSLTGEPRLGNDLLAQAMRDYPGRFLGYAVANPNRQDEVEPELARCLDRLGMKGIKVHDYFSGQPLDSPGYGLMYAFAQQRGGLPVLGHGLTPANVAVLAADYPAVPFIMAHAGGGYHGRLPEDDLTTVVRRHDNVFLDLASSLAYYGSLEALVRRIGAGKVLFGSDLGYQQLTHAIGRVLFANISEAEQEQILGGTAASLFRLE